MGLRKHILLVDDAGVYLRSVMGYLEGLYDVTPAISANMAKREIKTKKPDMILLDCNMPDVSGPEFMEQLRADEETKDIPIIFLTSKDDAATVKRVLELKPEGYILKSTPKEKMLSVIATYFKNH